MKSDDKSVVGRRASAILQPPTSPLNPRSSSCPALQEHKSRHVIPARYRGLTQRFLGNEKHYRAMKKNETVAIDA
jgi:hypothetical protein